jgi:hypothetical protein
LQKFPQIHFPSSVVAQPVRIVLHVAYRRINPGFTESSELTDITGQGPFNVPGGPAGAGDSRRWNRATTGKGRRSGGVGRNKPRIPFEVLGPAPKLLAMAIGWGRRGRAIRADPAPVLTGVRGAPHTLASWAKPDSVYEFIGVIRTRKIHLIRTTAAPRSSSAQVVAGTDNSG